VDDGARLWLNGRLLIDEWHPASGKRYETVVDLADRPQALRLDYYEVFVGTSIMQFRWEQEGGFGEQVVPAEALAHDPAEAARVTAQLPEADLLFFATPPKDAAGYLLRANAFYVRKDYDRSLADYRQWARLTAPVPEPKGSPAHNYYNEWAWRLAIGEQQARFAEAAVALATRACQITELKNCNYLDSLAAAFAAAGNFRAAVVWQQRACQIAAQNPESAATSPADFLSRLQLYAAGKPYRQPGK
jgi:hypothetical protein